MERNNKGIGSLAGVFQALAKGRAIVYIADGDYVRTTPSAGRDAAVLANPLVRTLQVLSLVGSRKHLNLSILCAQEVNVTEGRTRRPAAVPRLINFVRGGESCFDEILAVIPRLATFRALQAAGCLPAGAEHDPTLPVTLKVDHLPLVDARWADPERLVRFLRDRANLMAERTAFKEREIEPAFPKGSGLSEEIGRLFHKEDRTEPARPAPIEAPPPRVEYDLPGYKARFKGPDHLTPVAASERLRDIEHGLVSVGVSLSLVAIALETNPGKLVWTGPKPRGKAFAQLATVGDLTVRCTRSVPAATAAVAA